MKSDDILDAIGLVEDAYIKKAKEKKKSKKNKKNMWITIGTIAACLVLFFLIPNIPNFIGYNAEGPEDGNHVWIYYVDGNAISREQATLPKTSQAVFASWKEKNGIGEEVVLLDVTESPEEDGAALYITVSANIETYYETIDAELLLESLKQTMTGYSELVYDEYHISFV